METMKLTRHIHACVRIQESGTTVLVDPGSFGVPADLAEVDAVLITHAHPDHVDIGQLADARAADPELSVFAPASVAEKLPAVEVVAAGDRFTVGSLDIEVVGSEHATVLHCAPVAENIGYLFGGALLHPGDAFQDIPGVATALVPVNGPWVKMLDVENWLAKQTPDRFIPIHDGIVNDHGLAINHKQLSTLADNYGAEYVALAPGDSVDV